MHVPVWLTPAEVARLLLVDRKTVYRRLRSGELPGRRVGPQWRVDAADIGALLTPPAGTPRVAEPEPDEDDPEG